MQTTRDLIDRLKNDRTLRVLCGWRYKSDIPNESKFSRVFKSLSSLQIAQKSHEQFVKEYLSDALFFYNTSDATKIPLREKPLKAEKEEEKKPKLKRGRPKKGETREPIKPTILNQQKDMQTVEEMLSLVSTKCGVGVKQNSKGNREIWIGGKLHISAVDGDIPIVAFYSSANVHDSSVALPLIGETSRRVSYLYDLQDAGYDAASGIVEDIATSPNRLDNKFIVDELRNLKEQFQGQPNRVGELKRIDRMIEQYAKETPLTFSDANEVKRGIYRRNANAYSRDINPIKTEIDTSVARGIKKGIEEKIPEAGTLNRELGFYKQLSDLLEKKAARAERGGGSLNLKDLVGSTAAGAVLGPQAGGAAYLASMLRENPLVATMMAKLANIS